MYLKKNAKKNQSVQVSVVGDRELKCVEHVAEDNQHTKENGKRNEVAT